MVAAYPRKGGPIIRQVVPAASTWASNPTTTLFFLLVKMATQDLTSFLLVNSLPQAFFPVQMVIKDLTGPFAANQLAAGLFFEENCHPGFDKPYCW